MACKVEYFEAMAEDADILAEKMRESDRAECEASGFATPMSAVLLSMGYAKKSWSVWFNGELAGIFGVSPAGDSTQLNPRAVVWLLTTDVVEKYPKTFYKESNHVIHRLTQAWGTLYNVVDLRYKQALNWLYRLGFEIDGTHGFKGPNGDTFVLVTRRPWEEV